MGYLTGKDIRNSDNDMFASEELKWQHAYHSNNQPFYSDKKKDMRSESNSGGYNISHDKNNEGITRTFSQDCSDFCSQLPKIDGNVRSTSKGKKYTTGYGFFFREHHQQLLARNPYATFSELSKVIASKWRRLNRDQKQVYRNKVKKKPFSTSYGKFFRDNFKEVKESNPEATFGQISSLMSKKWDSLTWYERKSYERSTQTFHSDKKNFYNVDNANGEKPRDFGR